MLQIDRLSANTNPAGSASLQRRRHVAHPAAIPVVGFVGAIAGYVRRGRRPSTVDAWSYDLLGLADHPGRHVRLWLRHLADHDPVCQRLMSVPGVGPVTAIRFVAALDDVSRFPNAHAVQCYLGLVPGEDSSSLRKRRTAITKAGPPRVRWALAQAAWSLRHARKLDPLSIWAQAVEARRGKMIATTALARRLAGVLYALWRDGTRYEPSKLHPHAPLARPT